MYVCLQLINASVLYVRLWLQWCRVRDGYVCMYVRVRVCVCMCIGNHGQRDLLSISIHVWWHTFIYCCAVTHIYVWHDSFAHAYGTICCIFWYKQCLCISAHLVNFQSYLHMQIYLLYVLIHVYMSFICPHSCMHVPWCIYMSGMTHPQMCGAQLVCVLYVFISINMNKNKSKKCVAHNLYVFYMYSYL